MPVLLDSQHFCSSHCVWVNLHVLHLLLCVLLLWEAEAEWLRLDSLKKGPYGYGYLWIHSHLNYLFSIITKLCLGWDPILQDDISQLNHGAVLFLTAVFCFVHYSLPTFCKSRTVEALQAIVSSTTQSCHVSCTPSQLCSRLPAALPVPITPWFEEGLIEQISLQTS